jgi:hypothetical protein
MSHNSIVSALTGEDGDGVPAWEGTSPRRTSVLPAREELFFGDLTETDGRLRLFEGFTELGAGRSLSLGQNSRILFEGLTNLGVRLRLDSGEGMDLEELAFLET